MKILSIIGAVAGLLAATGAAGQEHRGPWSLQECIAYAIDHNISLKQQDIQVKQQEIQLETAKGNRLPRVSASASENFSFGRGLTSDNTYSNTNTTSTGLNLGTSVPIFQGSQIKNTIKQSELNLKAVTADFEKAKESVSVAVAQAYVQVLYSMELLDVALNQTVIDSLQLYRLGEMLSNGKASPAQVAQQKASLGQSKYSATQARNELNLSLLELSQLLELPHPEGFSIQKPAMPDGIGLLDNPEDIYAEALMAKPSVQAEQFRLDASDYSIKTAKGALLPSISASGGIGTNYYTMSGVASSSFYDQMKNNFSQSLGLSLSIPIFSGFQNRNQVKAARLNRNSQVLQLENVKKTLYKEVQQAYYNALAAQEKFRASIDARNSAKESYDLMLARYENEKANITEFNESRDNWLKAESDLARSRYEHLYASKLLDFYRGKPLAF